MGQDITLIITAAGSSRRFGENKLFLELQGVPLIAKTLSCFTHVAFKHVIITYRAEDKAQMEDALASIRTPWPLHLVEGGPTRRDSVENAVKLSPTSYVMIHDGARPYVSKSLIERMMTEGLSHKAAIPGLQMTDTVKWVEQHTVIKTVDRSFLYRVQTPQFFMKELLLNAYEKIQSEATDEAMILEEAGIKIRLVEGDVTNIKVTFPEDVKE